MKAVFTKTWQGAVLLVGGTLSIYALASLVSSLAHSHPLAGYSVLGAAVLGVSYVLGDKVVPLL